MGTGAIVVSIILIIVVKEWKSTTVEEQNVKSNTNEMGMTMWLGIP